MTTRRFVPMILTAALLVAGASAPRAQEAPVDVKAMEGWWADLIKDEPAASRALLKLAARPGETTAFLKDKMPPLTVDAERVQFLLNILGDEKEEIWKPAFEELEYFDPRLAIDLDTLMSTVTNTPARQRMVEVLSGRQANSLGRDKVDLRKFGKDEQSYNFFSGIGSWWAEPKVAKLNSFAWGNTKSRWTRAVRAIALLESFGTPEATDQIREMAKGHPDAQPTVVAKETLGRIGAAKP